MGVNGGARGSPATGYRPLPPTSMGQSSGTAEWHAQARGGKVSRKMPRLTFLKEKAQHPPTDMPHGTDATDGAGGGGGWGGEGKAGGISPTRPSRRLILRIRCCRRAVCHDYRCWRGGLVITLLPMMMIIIFRLMLRSAYTTAIAYSGYHIVCLAARCDSLSSYLTPLFVMLSPPIRCLRVVFRFYYLSGYDAYGAMMTYFDCFSARCHDAALYIF